MPDPDARLIVIDSAIAVDVRHWRESAAIYRRTIDRLNDELDAARRDLARAEAELAKLERPDAGR